MASRARTVGAVARVLALLALASMVAAQWGPCIECKDCRVSVTHLLFVEMPGTALACGRTDSYGPTPRRPRWTCKRRQLLALCDAPPTLMRPVPLATPPPPNTHAQTSNCWQNCRPSCPRPPPIQPNNVIVSGDRCRRAGSNSAISVMRVRGRRAVRAWTPAALTWHPAAQTATGRADLPLRAACEGVLHECSQRLAT